MGDKTDDYFDRLDAALAARAAGPPPYEGEPDKARPTGDTDGPASVSDPLIEEVIRRVMERLGPDVARDVVVQVVSEVAERLVREEIARIRNTHV